MPLCKCGCGEEVNPGRIFVNGHQRRGERYWKMQLPPQLCECECGCGQEVNRGKRFIAGHNMCKTPWTPTLESQLCGCGCGEYTVKGNHFINGHNGRKRVPEPTLCECGCGELANPGNRFINGHHNRGVKKGPMPDVHKKAISEGHLRDRSPLMDGFIITEGLATTNKNCPLYLGCFVAEHVLSKVFKDVQVMPHGNHGYDFICSRDYKVDVKSSCQIGEYVAWNFAINNNKTADYFLCIAFDNRKDLTPLHIWLIPGHVLNNQTCAGISESTLNKWYEYELPIDKVILCCDNMKSEQNTTTEAIT